MTALYLVSDEDGTIALAAEHDGRLYSYIPNVKAFVFNEPMSEDFLIDRDMRYEPVDGPYASAVIREGVIGKIDGRTSRALMTWARSEPRRLDVAAVLGATSFRSGAEPTATALAEAKVDILRKAKPGTWLQYKTYPATANRQQAFQLASHIRNGRVKAFDGLPVTARVVTSDLGEHVVQVSRSEEPITPARARAAKDAVRQEKPPAIKGLAPKRTARQKGEKPC